MPPDPPKTGFEPQPGDFRSSTESKCFSILSSQRAETTVRFWREMVHGSEKQYDPDLSIHKSHRSTHGRSMDMYPTLQPHSTDRSDRRIHCTTCKENVFHRVKTRKKSKKTITTKHTDSLSIPPPSPSPPQKCIPDAHLFRF